MKFRTNFKYFLNGSMIWFFLVVFVACGSKGEDQQTIKNVDQTQAETPVFSKEVLQVLEKKKALIETLAGEPVIIKVVKEYNDKNHLLTIDEILKLDRKWSESKGMDGFSKTFIINECARLIVDFQDEHEGFPEIFVTDIRGLIVGTSNKTSDYYQADEPWWVKTYNQGRGQSYFGVIEYDESSRAESIAIYVPVKEAGKSEVLGVLKAVCDLVAIKMEL